MGGFGARTVLASLGENSALKLSRVHFELAPYCLCVEALIDTVVRGRGEVKAHWEPKFFFYFTYRTTRFALRDSYGSEAKKAVCVGDLALCVGTLQLERMLIMS